MTITRLTFGDALVLFAPNRRLLASAGPSRASHHVARVALVW